MSKDKNTISNVFPPIPAQDFSKFGIIECRPLTRIEKIAGSHLLLTWLNVPHVTHQDEADISDLEVYRQELDEEARKQNYRVTLLSFLMKASVSALQVYPAINSSLSPEQDSLILKHYYNLGIAIDTRDGLVVPVIKNVDRKNIAELSQELIIVTKKAHERKLNITDMEGGSFTISNLGGIGGTGFTPIVNAPEVAILGVARSKMVPIWEGEAFIPRLMLPVFLSYDHRAIDGATAARFLRYLCQAMENPQQLIQ